MTIAIPFRVVVKALCVAALVGCAAPSTGMPSASSVAPGSPTAQEPPRSSATTPVAASLAETAGHAAASSAVGSVATSPAGSARATSRPTPSSDASGLVTITSADAGSTIEISVGQRVLLKLGTDLDWTVTVSEPLVLALVPGTTIVRGAQGLYRGQKPGSATINAVGDPPCRKSTPPCMAPSLLVSVTVSVS